MLDWQHTLENDAITPSVLKSAVDWRFCPVGQFHPQYVHRIHGTFDVTRDCPPKLTKLGMQFMDCVEAGENAKAMNTLNRIKAFVAK